MQQSITFNSALEKL